jgi:signal transduction histidine kinase
MMRVTHNLRAPLSAMISILDTVRGGYLGELSDGQTEYLRRLDRRARSMLTMINELMTLAESRRMKAGRADQPVDLLSLAARIRRTFENEAVDKGLLFGVTAPESLPSIQGDPTLVEQMLENLVSNAIKYTASGGRVEVTFARAHRTVRVEVSDTGIGIPKEAMPNLFKEFFRAENARSVETVGTGLGLAIVKEIVDKLGGRVLVESEPGLGTLFVVHLPLGRDGGHDPAAPAPGRETGGPPASPGNDAALPAAAT